MLHVSILIGLILGLGLGLTAAAVPEAHAMKDPLMALANGVAPLGVAFMNAINMVVVPLVMAVIFTGIAKLGDPRKLGRLGVMTLAFFWGTILPAILIGMGVMWIGLSFAPDMPVPPVEAREVPEIPGVVDFLVSLIPRNPFAAASSGALLPVIVFTALFAAAAGTLEEAARSRLVGFAEAVSDALIRLVYWILWTAPLGIIGLAAPATARLGWDFLVALAVLIVCVIVGLAVFFTVVYVPFLRIVGGIGPVHFLKSTFGGFAIAFSTTSTAAALPVMLEEADENLHLSPEIADLVIPLGASMYRAGSALFQGAAIIFLADLYHVPIPAAAVGGALLATFLVSLTVAPVPSSGVMTLAPALQTVGIPLEGLAILLSVDRIPDMFRSATNALGQVTTAVVMDRLATKDGATGDGPSTPPT
ncbi:MAG: dicarboxylate/amino acid:cation symporter [Gemmatimonadota bacterium]|nr:dicarboxylate/amino acid:cation symporter [Gemmatimonadota bacterium]MDH5760190.1 dicarboxylate/amino acid:cation symporter [Gemmatimonadota bacterium]